MQIYWNLGSWIVYFFPMKEREEEGEENKVIGFVCKEFTKATFHEKILKNVLILTAIFLQNMRILLNLPVNQCP